MHRTMDEISSNIVESQKLRKLYCIVIEMRYIGKSGLSNAHHCMGKKMDANALKKDLKWPTEMERYKARQTVFEFRIIYVSITFEMNTQELAFVGFQSIGKRMME